VCRNPQAQPSNRVTSDFGMPFGATGRLASDRLNPVDRVSGVVVCSDSGAGYLGACPGRSSGQKEKAPGWVPLCLPSLDKINITPGLGVFYAVACKAMIVKQIDFRFTLPWSADQ